MNKRILFFALSFIFLQNIFAHDELKVNVVISLENGKTNLELVRGRIPQADDLSFPLNTEYADALKSLDKKIREAKEIPLGSAEKACVSEGVYIIEYLDEAKKYEVQNDFWIYETESKKFLGCHILTELRLLKKINEQKEFYDKYYLMNYLHKSLSESDCRNIDFMKWLFTKESGISLQDKNIEIIAKEYSGGIPVSVKQFPVYFKVEISKAEFKNFKKELKKKSEWKIEKNEIRFMVVTKFDCCCVIKEEELLFGFGKMDIIHP